MTSAPVASAPALQGVLETGLYVAELERACAFYADVLGLRPMHRDARMAAYAIAPGQVLLLFLRGSTTTTVQLPGGTIPPHDGSGHQHYALAIASDALKAWEAHLAACHIAIEGRTHWPAGGHSLYVRDPDGHLGAGHAWSVAKRLRLAAACRCAASSHRSTRVHRCQRASGRRDACCCRRRTQLSGADGLSGSAQARCRW